MKDFWRLLLMFRPYRAWIIAGIGISFISLAANIILLSISGWFITTMAIAGAIGITVNYFTPAAIIRACAILRTGGRYAERLVTHEATFRFMAEMRTHLYQHIEAMPLAVSSRYHSGDLLTRLRGDIETLESFYIGLVQPCCVAFLALIASGLAFGFYSPMLAMIELLLLVLAGMVIPAIGWRSGRDPARRIVEEKSHLKIRMVENLQGFAEMQVYGLSVPAMQSALQQSDTLIARQKRMGMMDGIAQAATHFIAHVGLWVSLVSALILYQNGQIDRAHIPMLALMALACFEAVMPLGTAFQSLESCLQSARRLFALEDAPREEPEQHMPDMSGFDLRMDRVCFSYGNRVAQAVRDFSLHLTAGKIVMLAGPSGIGKSSIFHLLTGLYKPTSGQIIVNGMPYPEMAPETQRRFYSVVPQSPYIFSGTIRTNLLLGNPAASDAQLHAACDLACLDLPLDLYLGTGGETISGGEIRRLAMARAILRDAPCLLLDEPTEGLDQSTAAQVKQNLFAYAREKNKAVLWISHESGMDTQIDEAVFLS